MASAWSATPPTDIGNQLLNSTLRGLLGGESGFWKLLIGIDVLLATVACMKTKNPMVFGMVFATVFIPSLLLKNYVFSG